MYGTLTLFGQASQLVPLIILKNIRFVSLPLYYSYNPVITKATYTLFTVWASPVSLVTTQGISFDFFSIAT